MKKNTKLLITATVLIAILMVSFVIYNQINVGEIKSYTVFSNSQSLISSGFLSVTSTAQPVSTSNGDIYYVDVCEDVSPYYSQGYVFLRKDSDGCDIAGSPYIASSQDIGQRIGSFCYGGNYLSCGSGCSTRNDVCASTLGSSWSGSCGSTPSNNQFKTVICNLQAYKEVGGMKRIINKCNYDANDILVAESFVGQTTITKSSTRYPIKQFCNAHPAVVTIDSLKQSQTSTNVYQTIIDGGSVNVPMGETITLFYAIENNKNLPTICDSTQNLALDVNANITVCKSTLAFTYLCSEGIFDAKTGTCVVQPGVKQICEQGRYDVGLDACVYNPPIQYDCGSDACFYSVDRNVCSCQAKEEFSCDEGFTLFKPSQTQCADNGGVWQTCPQCPVGEICPTSICEPRCSIGVACQYDSPLIKQCTNANATIVNGKCVVYVEEQPQVVSVCPSETKYNKELNICEKSYQTQEVCADGTTPTTNIITGAKECVVSADKFVSCPASQVYDQSTSRCVDSIQVTTTNGAPVLYQEVRNGCTSDFSCSDGLVCNEELQICQTPFKVGTNWSFIGKLSLLLIGLALVMTLLLRKMRHR